MSFFDVAMLGICAYFFFWEGLRYLVLLFILLKRQSRLERCVTMIIHSRNVSEAQLWEDQAEAANRDIEKLPHVE